MRPAIEEELAYVDHSIDVIDPASDFLGCDVMEVILGDPGGLSATLAVSVAYEVVSPVALRRLGCETEAS
jgi:hypothetical protein